MYVLFQAIKVCILLFRCRKVDEFNARGLSPPFNRDTLMFPAKYSVRVGKFTKLTSWNKKIPFSLTPVQKHLCTNDTVHSRHYALYVILA